MEDSSSRKLIKWGSSRTLIMSLPRKWVKKNNLKPEQEIRALENPDGSLCLIPRELNEDSEMICLLEIKDEADLESIWLKLNTKYLDGWDVIKLTTKSTFSPQTRAQIEKLTNPLLGLEILGASSKEIIIKDVMSIGSSNLMSLIRMIGDHTIELGEMYIKVMESVSEREFIDPQIIRKSVQKYYFRITRELRKGLIRPILISRIGINMQDVLDISFFITNINDISENLSVLINTVKVISTRFSNEYGEIDFVTQILQVLKHSIDAFLFKNSTLAIDQIKNIDTLKKTRYKFREVPVEQPEEFLHLPLLIELNSKILDQSRIICFSALRRAI